MTDPATDVADHDKQGMWTGSRSHFPLSDRVDASRADLLNKFEDAPLARHDLELQLVVSSLRGSSRIPRYVLVRRATSEWQVVQISPHRGGAPALVSPRVFTRQDDAERFVLNLRIQALGTPLPATEGEG